ncbi:MAG: hypothetical protein DA407_07730 [Bacteroidetes bacterium]|nr:MAG: hypothetical protein DA407_07730 [Bacteroidota bacterium]
MLKTLNYSFCTVDVYSNFVIVCMNEGIHLTPDKNKILVDVANDYFKNKAFVYITHRKYSYSVDPSIYLKTSKIKNLAGFAVVAEVLLSKGNAEIEKLFLNKPFEIFTSIEYAKNRATKILGNEKV